MFVYVYFCMFLGAGSAQSTLLQPVVWLTIALATAICIVPVLAFRFLKLDLKPQLSDTVRKHKHTDESIFFIATTVSVTSSQQVCLKPVSVND